MTSVEEIEQIIKHFLLRDVVFSLEEKKLKSGKFMLFAIRDFFCIFTLFDQTKNKKIIYEIPYPFNIEHNDNKITFDYTLNTFCKNNKDIIEASKGTGRKKPSKFFNKKLVVYTQS